ncbi:hypothetical protein C0989_004253, partial [Termitomyces sp. Mn162]
SNTNQQSGDVEVNSTAVLFNSSSASVSGNILTQKHRGGDSLSTNYEDTEIAADSSYCHRTKVRVIQDPMLYLQNNHLSNQLNEERIRVNALNHQLSQIQQEQVATAWHARGIYDRMSSQLQAVTSERDSAVEELTVVAQALDMVSPTEEHVELSLVASNELAPSNQILPTNSLVQHAQALQASELQEHKQHFQEELKQHLQLQQQNLATQTAAEIQQRLDEQSHIHEQSLQAQVSRLEEEHRQQIMESTVARKEMESRIQELEEVQIQAANAIEQACTSAEAASRSETAFESILNHNTEVISDLQEQVECLEAQTASNNSHHVSNMATDPSQNKSLAEQFTDEILAADKELGSETREDVKTHFFQHLLTLKKELKCQTPRSHETEVQATQRAEWQHQITLARGRMQNRQLTLFKSREQICREGFNKSDHAIWEILLQLVLTLGSEGQSSNESEDEPETFSVRCWPWHNEHITELLQFIDSHRETLNNYGNNQSGKSFRKRERKSNPPLTQDRPIMRLPHNLYSNEFLSTRHLDQLCHLDV